jgi:hypothetical protein
MKQQDKNEENKRSLKDKHKTQGKFVFECCILLIFIVLDSQQSSFCTK